MDFYELKDEDLEQVLGGIDWRADNESETLKKTMEAMNLTMPEESGREGLSPETGPEPKEFEKIEMTHF